MHMPFLSISVGNVHCKDLHFGDECDMKVIASFYFGQVVCIPHGMIWPLNKHICEGKSITRRKLDL